MIKIKTQTIHYSQQEITPYKYNSVGTILSYFLLNFLPKIQKLVLFIQSITIVKFFNGNKLRTWRFRGRYHWWIRWWCKWYRWEEEEVKDSANGWPLFSEIAFRKSNLTILSSILSIPVPLSSCSFQFYTFCNTFSLLSHRHSIGDLSFLAAVSDEVSSW